MLPMLPMLLMLLMVHRELPMLHLALTNLPMPNPMDRPELDRCPMVPVSQSLGQQTELVRAR